MKRVKNLIVVKKRLLKRRETFGRFTQSFLSKLCFSLLREYDDSDDAEDDDFSHRFGAKSDATGRPVRRFKKTNLVGEIPDV